ncbi:MAG: bifunctional (p)ppGpp synthetase/guanosine-3',5'-bis(diphosphate) 3'-pyrophosphohydrolase [Gemmatimonadetes bacterium]|nr:bifunctional (p)ppGpp synthetase/guanosine-3',5'-bis(diphosphate) 3'-pyrophosphohydrolase [Gemmatimonadota bacterium]
MTDDSSFDHRGLDLAARVAAHAHSDHYRKETDIPYISHPFSVAMILAKLDVPDEALIAAMLHDTVEDTDLTIEDVREQFGDAVADIVAACSEPIRELPWEKRKEGTIAKIKEAPLPVRWVVAADKLHNLRSIGREFQAVGDRVWNRFSRPRAKQEWYYRNVLRSLGEGEVDARLRLLLQWLAAEVTNVFGPEDAPG